VPPTRGTRASKRMQPAHAAGRAHGSRRGARG
jgi:hypothetical protein